MKRAIIVHGWGGSPSGHWLPWMQSTLQEAGWRAEVPAMPSPEHPQRDEWVRHISLAVGHPDRDTFLVGHSLGCIAILRYLETLAEGERIGGAVLVSGFFEPLGEGYEDIDHFVRDPVDWEAVRNHCLSFRVIHGKDDDIVPLPFAERLAMNVRVPLHVIPGKHLGKKEGILELPPILNAVLDIAG